MRIEVIIFDWGGTLAEVVRQDQLWRQGASRAIHVLGAGDDPQALGRLIECMITAEARAAADPRLREASLTSILADWARLTGRSVAPVQAEAAIEAMVQAWSGSLEPLPGAVSAVRTLRGLGCRLGLVSNCIMPVECCRQELARQGFEPLLDFAIFSSGVGYRKPSPVIYDAAIAAAWPAGRPEDLSRVLFVGDSPTCDIIAPAQLGMRTALVHRPPGVWPAEGYARARPDLRIECVAELPALLGG